ncbi:MAG: PQQ-dependent sugar dehydrogenase [Bacteroidota bacterium]
MTNSLLLTGTFIAGLIFACQQYVPIPQDKKTTQSAAASFQEWCAGCHGQEAESFIDYKWKYGNTQADLVKAIKYGYPDEGMPAYEETFSDEEIAELATYILNEVADKNNRYKFEEEVQSDTFYASKQTVKLDTILSDIGNPWGMDFLPNGDMLVTIQSGELYRVDVENKRVEIQGVPKVRFAGQGGLLDVCVHPNFDQNQYIYISYSKFNPNDDSESTTALFRAQLNGNQLVGGQDIFVAEPYVSTKHHYGSRIVFDPDGYLYLSVGDRGKRDDHPQYLSNDSGKVHRLNDDGGIPRDNPFIRQNDTSPSIFTYGHRNPQGLAIHPTTGAVWEHEHGPRGGDEVNLIEPGNNYGWPVISYGINYSGTKFTDITEKEGMEQPKTYWDPSIAPCGMTFVAGSRYPDWQNQLLVGSLKFDYVNLCRIEGEKVVGQELILKNIGRVRSLAQDADGYLYVGVEDPGFVFRLMPVK